MDSGDDYSQNLSLQDGSATVAEQVILDIASKRRNCSCVFGKSYEGEYNIARTITFADGIEKRKNSSLFDLTTGALTGIFDWEFANTLPLQVPEHYPKFLSRRDGFVEFYRRTFDSSEGEFNIWLKFYMEQFDTEEDPEVFESM